MEGSDGGLRWRVPDGGFKFRRVGLDSPSLEETLAAQTNQASHVPKTHLMMHVVSDMAKFGRTINYTTEAMERRADKSGKIYQRVPGVPAAAARAAPAVPTAAAAVHGLNAVGGGGEADKCE